MQLMRLCDLELHQLDLVLCLQELTLLLGEEVSLHETQDIRI